MSPEGADRSPSPIVAVTSAWVTQPGQRRLRNRTPATPPSDSRPTKPASASGLAVDGSTSLAGCVSGVGELGCCVSATWPVVPVVSVAVPNSLLAPLSVRLQAPDEAEKSIAISKQVSFVMKTCGASYAPGALADQPAGPDKGLGRCRNFRVTMTDRAFSLSRESSGFAARPGHVCEPQLWQ